MIRIIGSLLLVASLSSLVAGCVVEERPRCRYGWEPEHRDRAGRLVGGHCR
jgi:hypothetical protein